MHDKELPALAFVWQEAQNGRPARPEGVRPRSVLSVREDAERLSTPLADFFSLLLAGCCRAPEARPSRARQRIRGLRVWAARCRPFPRVPAVLLLALLGLGASCSTPEDQKNRLQEDLTKYMDQARLWAATEAQINNAISNVRRDQFVHDDFVIDTLKPAVGTAHEYVLELENYRPELPATQGVHQGYIEAWRAHEFALASIVNAAETKDYRQLAKANTELLEAQRAVSDGLAALARLLQEAGLGSETPAGIPPAPPSGPGFEITPRSPS